MAQRKLEVVFLGDTSGFGKAADEVGNKLGGLGKLVAGAALAGGVAAVGFGAVSLKAFGDFEQQMKEVFTLLPGISGDAMADMQDQVKDFAKEFGVLPSETVPALYQALSAGVPQNNVFSFLETAQKAAKGGVTDLTTAVDGISSVVNAYGAEVLDATQASDLMFTAVKLGKTDFESLSKSLFNVIPTAASLGIGMEQITASLARMTAQGTPTAVATTQLRSLFVEASKDGSKLANAIKNELGLSFTELIKEGGDVATIMNVVRGELGDDEFRNLFGSVEALNAALATSGANYGAYADALGEMENSAGATDAAFQTMSGGLKDSIAKIKANISVLLIEVGERLAPVFAAFLSWVVEKAVPALNTVLAPAFEALGKYVEWLVGLWGELGSAALSVLGPALEALGGVVTKVKDEALLLFEVFEFGFLGFTDPEGSTGLTGFFYGLGKSVREVREAFGGLMGALGPAIDVLKPLAQDILASLRDMFGEVYEALKPLMEAFAEWEPALKPIATLVGTVLVASIAAVMVAIEAWVRVTTVVLVVAIKALTVAVEVVTAVVKALAPIVEDVSGKVSSAIQTLWSKAQGPLNFVKEAIDKIGERAAVLASGVGTILGLAAAGFEAFKNTVKPPIDAVIALIQTLIDMVAKIPTPGDVLGKVGDLGGAAKGAVGKLNPFASGTPSAPAGWAIVGEEGPELVNLRGGERIYSAPETAAMFGGGGGNYTFNVTIQGNADEQVVRRGLFAAMDEWLSQQMTTGAQQWGLT